jgi:glycosyltransferase involved in cell wall biosynthesis
MKIAQVVAAGEGREPRARDVERLVGYLTSQLAADGHEATLFPCTVGVQARVHGAVREPPLSSMPPALAALISHASRFDIIHVHGDLQRFSALSVMLTPVVATIHAYPSPRMLAARPVLPEVELVAVSAHQRNLFPGLRWRATVQHGLPEGQHTFRSEPRNYLSYVGSLTSVNSLRRAVEIALRSRLPLKIARHIVGRELRQLEQHLAPLIAAGASIEFVGDLETRELGELLGNARALLFTNEWSEPCPLAVLDALACGTPVIAWRSGAVEEIIDHGRSGFIVSSVEDAIRAVADLDLISRLDCRLAFDERFGAKRMARDYVALYEELLAKSERIKVARCEALGGRASLGQDGGAL